MSQHGSITQLFLNVANGDENAAHDLWEKFRKRLIGLARKKLEGVRKGAGDEEDVAIEAFHSLLKGANAGRYDIPSRDELWQLLAFIAVRKANGIRRKENAEKRKGLLGESAINAVNEDGQPIGMEMFAENEPSPASIAQLNILIHEIHEQLKDAIEIEILTLKLEGYSHRETAERLGIGLWRVRKTVEKVEQYLTK
ncbi:MAG: hypothetical protein COA78_15705 [Blastopirellula sp.]|nr:MAG: hypothetical protein COA78_15705 [Blastopirellula sp.]